MIEKEFNSAIKILKSLNTEEDIIRQITFLVKRFDPYMYSEIILSNPYYMDIFIEIKEHVISELLDLKKSINKEISSIDNDKFSDSDQLDKLRRYCISLLDEIDNKISDIKSLVLKKGE